MPVALFTHNDRRPTGIIISAGYHMLRWLALLFCLLCLHATPVQPVTIKQRSLAVIAYYSGNATDLHKYAVHQLTHIIYSFTLLRGNKLYIPPAVGTILKKLVSLKKQYPVLKISVAFAGWGGCKTCSNVFAIDSNRKAFARSVADAINQHQLDGIDIDWEYPAI
jgi:chitinase